MQIDSKDIFILEFSDSGTFRINNKRKNKSNSGDEDANDTVEKNDLSAAANAIEEETNPSNSIYPTGKIKIRQLTEAQVSIIKKYVSIPPPSRGFTGKKGVTGL